MFGGSFKMDTSNPIMHSGGGSENKQSTSRNNLGLISLNQMELKNELKRIELCRRQYELSYVHEQRKLITRIANKLIHSNSNLDVIFNPARNRQSISSYHSAPPPVSSKHQQSSLESESSSQKLPLPLSTMKRGITYIGFTPSSRTSDDVSRQSMMARPITSLPPPPTTAPSSTNATGSINDRFPSIQQMNDDKKRVKWRNEVDSSSEQQQQQQQGVKNTTANSSQAVSTPSSQPLLSKARVTSMYELNKKYDELRLKYPDREPKVFLPLLVSANRREPSSILIGSGQNSEKIAEENRRRINECKQTFFKKIVDREDSGFYTYKDAQGQPVCLGYDNYGMLLKSSTSNRSNINSTPINLANAANASNQLDKRRKSRMVAAINNAEERIRIDPNVLRAKTEEENKLCNDTFKAQTIKSLTFKNVITY